MSKTWTLKMNDRLIEQYPGILSEAQATNGWANPDIADRFDRGRANETDRFTLDSPDGRTLLLERGTCPFLGMGNYHWLAN